jgi:homoserine kinase type II
MAVFTRLTPADVTTLLTRYRLGELMALEGVGAGIENTNYFATTTAGAFVLTVFERLTFEQLPFYLELMRHAARRGLPVPMPQEHVGGALVSEIKGKPCAFVTRLPGHAVELPNVRQCEAVGEFLARLHVQCADFALFQPHLRGIGWWKSTLPLLEPRIADDLFHELAEEVIVQDSFFRSALFEKLPSGPIHADLFRDNVLWQDATNVGATIGGVIDFYFAGCSLWLFDVAVTVNDWCVDLDSGAFDQVRAKALLAAYHAVRPLTDDEHAAWPIVLRAAALRFWISRLHDLHLPRDAHLLTPHDPARFERMLRRRIADPTPPWV